MGILIIFRDNIGANVDQQFWMTLSKRNVNGNWYIFCKWVFLKWFLELLLIYRYLKRRRNWVLKNAWSMCITSPVMLHRIIWFVLLVHYICLLELDQESYILKEVLMRPHFCQWEFSQPDLILLNQALSSFPESRTDRITVQSSELQLNYATCLHLQVQNFGEPFFLVMRDNETLGEVKERIQKKLQVPDEEFAKVGSHFSWSPRNWKDMWRVVYFSLLISSLQWF